VLFDRIQAHKIRLQYLLEHAWLAPALLFLMEEEMILLPRTDFFKALLLQLNAISKSTINDIN
jgi:hypothetical protein